MRMAVAACALAIAVFLAIFGVVLAQKGVLPIPMAAAPTAAPKEPAAKVIPAAVVTEVTTPRAIPAAPSVAQAAAPAPAPAPSSAAAAPATPVDPACAGNPNTLGVA